MIIPAHPSFKLCLSVVWPPGKTSATDLDQPTINLHTGPAEAISKYSVIGSVRFCSFGLERVRGMRQGNVEGYVGGPPFQGHLEWSRFVLALHSELHVHAKGQYILRYPGLWQGQSQCPLSQLISAVPGKAVTRSAVQFSPPTLTLSAFTLVPLTHGNKKMWSYIADGLKIKII